MAGWKSRGNLREIGERLTGTLETVLTGWERSRLVVTYTRLRRRISGPPLPGVPETADLNPYVFLSLGLHLLAALVIYALAARAISLAERPPISIRILESPAQAPVAAQEQKSTRQALPPKPQPTHPPEPILAPKTIPWGATGAPPLAASPIPKSLPGERVTAPKASTPDLMITEKGLLPPPVTPFKAESPPGGAPAETPRSFTGAGPTLPETAPAQIAPLPPPSRAAPATTQASAPLELRETTLGGFQQPTGPVVVPERFLKGGRPETAPGAGRVLIDPSDPDFTEYFAQVKRRVYATWRYPEGVRGVHEVWLRFSLDRAGASQGVQVVRSNNPVLNASAVEAMHRASPFPPIPEKFRALVGQPLILKFTVTIQ
ncbi:MAG: TonB family protein [Candidatus Methylomirabilales bacterium]